MAHVFIPDAYEAEPTQVINHYAPLLAKAGLTFSSTVYQETKLPFRVIEAARMRTAQINGCITCQSWRAGRDLPASLKRKGLDPSRSFVGRGEPAPDEAFYAAVEHWRTANVFSDRERLAIDFAERMGADPKSFRGDDTFWTKMHAAFTDAEIVDLTLSVASWIAMGRTIHVLAIDPEVCPVAVPSAAE